MEYAAGVRVARACSGALDAQLVRAARRGREAPARVRGQLAALPHRSRPVAVRKGAPPPLTHHTGLLQCLDTCTKKLTPIQ